MAAVGVLSSWPAAAISRSRLSRIVRSETSRMATTPPHVRSWLVERLGHGLEPAPRAVRIADRELHAEPLAARGPLLWPLILRQGQAGQVLGLDLGVGTAEEPVVGRVRRERPALVVDGDDGVAEAREDRLEAVVLLLAVLLLLLERHGLEPQLIGARGEVLVRDPQLLDARGQLLVERLELLVRRLELLVEGLDLLSSRLGLLARLEHRLVGQPELGDQRGQLLVGAQQPPVDDRPPVRAGARRARLASAVALGPALTSRQLDDRALDRTRLPDVRPDDRLDEPGALGRRRRRPRPRARSSWSCRPSAASIAARMAVDGQRLGEVDEVLVERQAVDPEHPPGGRVDPGDVVAGVDDDDPEPQVEQQRLGRLRRIGRDLDVPARRPDRRVERHLELRGRPNGLAAGVSGTGGGPGRRR